MLSNLNTERVMTLTDLESPARRSALLVGALVFLSVIYFYEGGGWNQNSRFDLVRAIVEQHTLRIDSYHENTQDKAHFQGHYYSDKAPGVAFLGVPVAFAVRAVQRAFRVDPYSPRGEYGLSYLVGAGTIALPVSLSAITLFFLGLRFGAGQSGAAFGALATSLGTPMWAYGGLFWGHALAGACLLFALAAALRLKHATSSLSVFCWAFAVGIAAGWATVTEYPAAPASAALAVLALSQSRRGRARWITVGGISIGATLCIAVLLGYLYAAFGSVRPSYSYYDPTSFSFMQQQGYMGLTYPHPDRLLKLLFGCSRGLFFLSPITLAACFGLVRLWRQRTYAAAALVAACITAYYFLFNASFYWWKAGLSFGPRYAGACIPPLCCGLPVLWRQAPPLGRRVLILLAGIGSCIALMAVSTTSQLSMQDSCPLIHSVLPDFWAGRLALNRDSMLTLAEAGSGGNYGAFNLGQLLGLHGLASLLPLFAAWTLASVLWMRIHRVRSV